MLTHKFFNLEVPYTERLYYIEPVISSDRYEVRFNTASNIIDLRGPTAVKTPVGRTIKEVITAYEKYLWSIHLERLGCLKRLGARLARLENDAPGPQEGPF